MSSPRIRRLWLHTMALHGLASSAALALGIPDPGGLVLGTPASRAFAVLLGLAALWLVTVSVAAMFVESGERKIGRELLHERRKVHRELAELREDVLQLRTAQNARTSTSAPRKP